MHHKSKLFSIIIGLFFGLFYLVNTLAATVVKVAVANMYATPSENSSLASQAIYGSEVKILASKSSWYSINTDDGYQGWVKKSDLTEYQIPANATLAKVTNLFAFVYVQPTTIDILPLIMLPSGAVLPIIKTTDDGWVEVQLVNGMLAWIQQGDVTINPEPMTMKEMLAFSHKFIGFPYLWGGTSTYGFDCSGFVQFLFRNLGIILPRDTNLQANSPLLFEVSKAELKPGDIIFLGFDNKISHEGIYLGNNIMINETAYANPTVQLSNLNDPHWKEMYITARRLIANVGKLPEFQGNISPLSETMKQKMLQSTWREGCPVALEGLSAVEVTYLGFDGKKHLGTLIVNSKLAEDTLDIFTELYALRFPIEKIRPIEEYAGNDNDSMADNNSSAFNCRAMTDFKNKYSIHSYGYAIDINPLINPYVNGGSVAPKEGVTYADRGTYHKGKITAKSGIVQIFAKHGWLWGGSDMWSKTIKDYQHFEKR